MIKKLLMAALVALPLAVSAQKIATVDVQAVVEALPAYTEMQTKIANASKTYEDEMMNLRNEMDKKYAEVQQLPEDTPQAIRERRVKEVQDLNAKFEMFVQQAQQDIQRQQMQLMQPIQEQVLQAIQTVGQQGGYLMVLPSEVPYYVSGDVVDVTPQVKTALGI